MQWRNSLVNLFGTRRWYLNVDCDEYFVYGNMTDINLTEYTGKLKYSGIHHVPAPMIDLYPSEPLSSAEFTGDLGKMPWHVANLFDRTGYRLFRSGSAMLMSGGPRLRMIGNLAEHDELMKYPLLYMEEPKTLSISVHKPWPFERNFSPILGALLHFKFFNDTDELARAAIADAQYYKGESRAYKNLLSAMKTGALGKLHDQNFTTKYKSPDQLLKLGFFKELK